MATRKDREREKARRDARRREWQAKEADNDLSQTLLTYDDVTAGQRVFLILRVSTPEQEQNGDLRRQEAAIRARVIIKGDRTVGAFRQVGSGSDLSWLKEAGRMARQAGATMALADTACRVARPNDYSKFNQHACASKETMQEAVRLMGMPIATCLPPNATLHEVRAHQIKRGRLAEKARKGTSRKQQRDKYLNRAKELRRQGLGYRRIADVITAESGVPTSHITVRKWLKPLR